MVGAYVYKYPLKKRILFVVMVWCVYLQTYKSLIYIYIYTVHEKCVYL